MIDVVQKLHALGQSIWYDNIERKLLQDGTLAELINKGVIRGITSNPSIFNKAISQSADYDDEIKRLIGQGLSNQAVYEHLAIRDIQQAADLFLPLYSETDGGDGFVSLEVSPYLANDTQGTIDEAKRLWKEVNRPNLMVKIPATKAGLPAITESIAAGLNINVTLIFSLERYRQVLDAYLSGLEKRISMAESIEQVASVASFFISRIDTKVDQYLNTLLESKSLEDQNQISQLMGKTAVASGKLAYIEYEKTFGPSGNRFLKLIEYGAKRQRILWASTSTKNPIYPDTKYVDEMIGPFSINTIPPKTLDAFIDHGVVSSTIEKDIDEANQVMKGLSEFGIDLGKVTQELEDEGVKSFADAFTALLDSLHIKIDQFQSE